jgi:hypothetical protein
VALAPQVVVVLIGVGGVLVHLGAEVLARRLAKHPRLSNVLLVVIQATRGTLTALLVYLTVVTFVRDPGAALRWSQLYRIGLAVAFLYAMGLAARSCIRAQLKVRSRSEIPDEPYVLFLRSFSADWVFDVASLMLGAHALSQEEELARVFKKVGRVLTVARPGAAPELGAERIALDHEAWRRDVAALVARAKAIILRLGSSEGLVWELRLLATYRQVPTLYVLPPLPEREAKDENYEKMWLELRRAKVDLPLPWDRRRARYAYFDQQGRPQLLTESTRAGLAVVRLYHGLQPFFRASGLPQERPRTSISDWLTIAWALVFCLYLVAVLLVGQTVGLRW